MRLSPWASGRACFGIKHGDTDYKVCLLPLGGYVKMTGENPGEEQQLGTTPALSPSHPRWQRMLIGLAGPVANFMLAFVLMIIYFGWINEVPDIKTTTTRMGHARFRCGPGRTYSPGDVIRHFGTVENPDSRNSRRRHPQQRRPDPSGYVTRGGKTIQMSFHVPDKCRESGFELSQTGLFLQYAHGPIGVDQTVPGSPAEQAGLEGGDEIVAADGHAFHTVDPLLDYLQLGQGKPVTLTVRAQRLNSPAHGRSPNACRIRSGVLASWPFRPRSADAQTAACRSLQAVGESRDFCAENSLLIVDVLQKLLTRRPRSSSLPAPWVSRMQQVRPRKQILGAEVRTRCRHQPQPWHSEPDAVSRSSMADSFCCC